MSKTNETVATALRGARPKLIDQVAHAACMAVLHICGDRALSAAELRQVRTVLEELLDALPKA